MNIAFVSTRKDIGGVTVYISRLMDGLDKVGCDNSLVLITRGNGKAHIRAWSLFGKRNFIVTRTAEELSEALNTFDMVVYDMPGGFDDIKYHREHGNDSMPWFYDGILSTHTLQTALLLDTRTLTKYCPYIDVWENHICKFFISIKTGLSNLYQLERGILDTYTIDVPISVDETDLSKFGKRDRRIISTNRVYPEKRLHFLVDAIKMNRAWQAELHSSVFFYHYAKTLEKDFGNNITWFKDKDIDYDIYYGSALTYAASYFGGGDEGGMECVSLEGAVRGSVPLLSENWVAPNLDSPPEDIVYKFSVNGKFHDLVDVLATIDPSSKDYLRRQREIFEWVKKYKRDTLQAKRLMWLCKEFGNV